MRDAREYATSFVLNGEMVVAGGFNNRAGWLDSVERRPSGSNNSWVVEREWDLPKGVMNLCAEAVDDTKFIVTGTVICVFKWYTFPKHIENLSGGSAFNTQYFSDVSIFDTVTKTWETTASMDVGKASHGCMTIDYNGEPGLMVTGGCTNSCQV